MHSMQGCSTITPCDDRTYADAERKTLFLTSEGAVSHDLWLQEERAMDEGGR
ncbi:predicted protein [Plenodomus lingam JN3]|uniref:Predicted protein n=1 Tax=Leptosphaeria maculans (strain JN3 / isolate v23.1.3 / race Av1-4-5-6-7-8) TaxID=985895 RepID=E5AEE1_LEPMJ|nr:predicted protein [Plenodomus lingam JN3]CBY01580.1 predicted protein [Plenodomus lingam JN3]